MYSEFRTFIGGARDETFPFFNFEEHHVPQRESESERSQRGILFCATRYVRNCQATLVYDEKNLQLSIVVDERGDLALYHRAELDDEMGDLNALRLMVIRFFERKKGRVEQRRGRNRGRSGELRNG